jgi:hypothetical protein
MNWKRTLILWMIIHASNYSFSQLTQTGNSYEKLNSATAGLFFNHEANYTTSIQGSRDFFRSEGIANYSTVSKNGKYGFGVNYQHHFYFSDFYKSTSNLLKVNVNRQFTLNNSSRLAVGLGLGGGLHKFSQTNVYSGRVSNTWSDLSIAYSSKRFKAGASLMGFYSDKKLHFNGSVFSSYTFGNSEKLQFTPHVFLGLSTVNIGATLAYKNKFFLGGGVKHSQIWNPYATVGIRLWDKFQLNYSVDFRQGYLPSGVPSLRHEFGVSYQIGRR